MAGDNMESSMRANSDIRHDWTAEEILEIMRLPFPELIFRAQTVHRKRFNPCEIQISSLLSIKTGSCPEDCKYCPQSGKYATGVEKERLLAYETIIAKAKQAKAAGATRFCMGAAWRNPKDKDMPLIADIIKGVKSLGLETCMTLGMLSDEQTAVLAEAGLDYYNHNLDTSPEFYGEIISTRTYADRLDTIALLRKHGIKICCGGILGMGETEKDRASFLRQLAILNPHPESVPINLLVKIKGTPLEKAPDLDPIDFIRVVATARIIMPDSVVRLSAGREKMTDEFQALCFLAGASSIFYGTKLLTAPNAEQSGDDALIEKLGMSAIRTEAKHCDEDELKIIFESIHEGVHEDQDEHKGCFRLE